MTRLVLFFLPSQISPFKKHTKHTRTKFSFSFLTWILFYSATFGAFRLDLTTSIQMAEMKIIAMKFEKNAKFTW